MAQIFLLYFRELNMALDERWDKQNTKTRLAKDMQEILYICDAQPETDLLSSSQSKRCEHILIPVDGSKAVALYDIIQK